jgi:O-antigen ligase
VDWFVRSDVRLYAIGLEPWRPWEPLATSTSGRITGTLGISSNFFGALMIIPTTLAAGLFGGAATRKVRWAFALSAFATTMALSLSFTRASIVAMFVGFVVLAIAMRRIRVLALVVALVIAVLVLTPVATRFGAEHNRFNLISTALDVISSRPFTGAGEYTEGGADLSDDVATITNQQGDVITPHNSFLLAAAETGIPGGGLLLLGAALPGAFVLIAAFRRRPEQAVLAGLAAGMAGYGVQTFSNNLFHIPNVVPFYWLAAAAGVGVVWRLRGERESASAQD